MGTGARSWPGRGASIAAGLAGLAALACLVAARSSYGEFMPLRGYSTIHAHVMAPEEGLFLALYTVLGTIAAAGLGLGAMGLTRLRPAALLERAIGGATDGTALVVAAALAALASLLVTRLVLEGGFLTDDETAMLFQARLLADGRLWAEPPPYPAVLDWAMVIEAPRWYGMYPIGHSAVMAAGLLATGEPRAAVPVLAACWAVLTFLLARRLYDRPTAFLATALLLLSPFFVLTSGTLASQMTSGALLLAAANLAVRLDGGRRRLLLALGLGAALGAAAITRPYSAVAVGLPLGCLVGWLWLSRRVPVWTPFAVLGAAAPFVAGYLLVNRAQTGSLFESPYEVNFPGTAIGFGQVFFGVEHTPALALTVAGLVVLSLGAWALGWPLSLLPVGLGLGLERPRGRALVVGAIPLVALVAHLPVPIAGVQDTGPLYYFEVLPVLLVLAARGLLLAARRLEPVLSGRGRDLVAWTAVAAFVVGGVFFSRQQVEVIRSLAAWNEEPYRLAERVVEGRAVVFVEDIQTVPPSSWVLGNRPPRPDLSDRIVYGEVPGEALAAEIARTTGRMPYYLSRDERTGDVTLVPLPLPAEGP